MIFKTCENCGAHLDAGETCDCIREESSGGAENKAKEKHPAKTKCFSFK